MKLRYKIALGSFVGLLVFLAAVAWLIQWSGQRALEHEIQQVIAAGGARDFSAFDELNIPDDQNAALAWLAAAAELERINALAPSTQEQELEGEILGGGWDEAEPDTLRLMIEKRQSAIEMAWDAAELTAVRWPLDYRGEVYTMDISYMSSCRGLARLMVADAHLSGVTKDTLRADRSFAAALSLGEDVVEFPVVLSTLLGFAIDGFVVGQLENE